jgi:hypothetical protein
MCSEYGEAGESVMVYVNIALSAYKEVMVNRTQKYIGEEH